MINVSKPYLPPVKEYTKYLERIWDNRWLTNQGPLVTELERSLEEYLGVKHVHFVSSGTTALLLAIKAAKVSGEVITTPFSHISTLNSILWSGCTAVFADIDGKSLCIDTAKIESLITDKTTAILATHVFGNPCDVKRIKDIASANNLKVIYDSAHAFNLKMDRESIFNYGDINALSLHATKLYHTVEGGAIITNDSELDQQSRLLSNFGLHENMPVALGINGKNSEFHAAVGLCTLPSVPGFIKKRKSLSEAYRKQLANLNLQYPERAINVDYNYAYFPVIFPTETVLLYVLDELKKSDIYPRRYFYPSLSGLPFYKRDICAVAEDISKRILCLPLYHELTLGEVKIITGIITTSMADFHSKLRVAS